MAIISAHRIPPRRYNTRHTGAQLRGIRYQKALGRELTKHLASTLIITHEPWYEYTLRGGYGFTEASICAPDFLIESQDFAIVVEVKLTFVFTAIKKLTELYIPVVKLAHPYLRQVVPLIITKTLTPSAPKTITHLSHALNMAKDGEVPVFQWLDKRSPLAW